MCVIGLDPSINSTGVCVSTGEKDRYYIITPKMTKKMKEFNSKVIKYLPYEKTAYTDMEYHEKEVIKSHGRYYRVQAVNKQITEFVEV